MFNLLLPVLLPALAQALPAPAEPTLITFTYDGQLVTATYTGTDAPAPSACPTQTFTYNGAVITTAYTGPGTPQSCLTSANAPAATTSPATPAVVPGNMGTNTQSVSQAAVTTAASPSTTAAIAAVSGSAVKGFNYGSTGANGAPLAEADYTSLFARAASLPGASGFTSARLYTMIQGGTTNTPISAIPAAISSGTTLLLGLWASAGQANIDNEIAALQNAINQYGTAFTDLIVGISVGSEDLYRVSATGIENHSGVGADAATVASYISQVKAAIAGTAASGKLVGHVDAYPTWNDPANAPVIEVADFLGLDAYPYFQYQMSNPISSAAALFKTAYSATQSVSQGKPVWITETGFPSSGPTSGNAVPSVENAKTYWDEIGCDFAFGNINTYWYTLDDTGASPAFGVDNSGTETYDLSCSA